MFGQMATEDGINLTIYKFLICLVWMHRGSLQDQVELLKNWYDVTGMKYALDKSLAEAVLSDDSSPQAISSISDLLKSQK